MRAPGRPLAAKRLASGVQLVADPADETTGSAMLCNAFEVAELAFARRVVRPGGTAVDAGAHIGLYALHLAHDVGEAGHVYAFEPFPANADLLDAGIAANGFERRITVARVAVGERRGTAALSFAADALDSGTPFLTSRTAPMLPGEGRLSVPMVALDECDLRRPVALIKLDVEGAEARALQGAWRLLRADRPVLVCELHYAQLARVSGASPQDLFDRLAAIGYVAHEITPWGDLGARLPAPPPARVSTVAFVARP